MRYEKQIMRLSELEKMGFPKEYLMRAYKSNKRIAWKLNPAKDNSPLLFDTEALEEFRNAEIEQEERINAHSNVVV